MKLPGNRLRMSDGSVRRFKSALKRAEFERIAEAIKHGWKPTGRGRKPGRSGPKRADSR